MRFRDLVVEIPEPSEEGTCNSSCPLFSGCSKVEWIDSDNPDSFLPHSRGIRKPGPQCPWNSKYVKDCYNLPNLFHGCDGLGKCH